jgi:hypothetical protein
MTIAEFLTPHQAAPTGAAFLLPQSRRENFPRTQRRTSRKTAPGLAVFCSLAALRETLSTR